MMIGRKVHRQGVSSLLLRGAGMLALYLRRKSANPVQVKMFFPGKALPRIWRSRQQDQ